MWADKDIFIIGAKRTPCGVLQGCLSDLTAAELGAIAHRAVLEQAQIDPSAVDEVLSGCVLQAAQGQGPARQAAVQAGLPYGTATTTVNKMCGSGMVSVFMGCNSIKAGEANVVLAGGFESMSNSPYLLPKARYN
jgi:acetyl-CoA C-acetyltransferase